MYLVVKLTTVIASCFSFGLHTQVNIYCSNLQNIEHKTSVFFLVYLLK